MNDNLMSNKKAIKILRDKIKMCKKYLEENIDYKENTKTLIKALNTAIEALEKEV